MVKAYKNGSAQQAYHVEGFDVRLCNYFHTVWEKEWWGAPEDLTWLAETRHERREERAARRHEKRRGPPTTPLREARLHDGTTHSPEVSDTESTAGDPLTEEWGEEEDDQGSGARTRRRTSRRTVVNS